MFWTYSKRSPGPGCAGDSEPSIVQSDCTSDVSTSTLQRRLDENHEKSKRSFQVYDTSFPFGQGEKRDDV